MAALETTLALMRVVVALPGWMAPTVICVSWPIEPTGVVLFSPVTRQATSARMKDITSANTASQ